MLCKPPHCNEEGYRTSMAGETAFPRHEYLSESLPAAQIVVRLIEEAMTQAGTYYGSYQKGVEKRIKKGLGHALPPEEPSEYEPTEYESRNEKK